VPDFAGAGEIGFGLKICKGVKRPLVPGGFQFEVDEDDVVDQLDLSYINLWGNKEKRDEMVERSVDYRIGNIMEKYMIPTLTKIQGELT
jgi:hypothetical protein